MPEPPPLILLVDDDDEHRTMHASCLDAGCDRVLINGPRQSARRTNGNDERRTSLDPVGMTIVPPGPANWGEREDSAMADTAADVLVETIHDWGVDVVFGLPGDGINEIMEALRTRQDRVQFVQATKNRRPSWPAHTPSSLDAWASAWPHRAPAPSTCSTACTSPRPGTGPGHHGHAVPRPDRLTVPPGDPEAGRKVFMSATSVKRSRASRILYRAGPERCWPGSDGDGQPSSGHPFYGGDPEP
jgi:hypothetical protein